MTEPAQEPTTEALRRAAEIQDLLEDAVDRAREGVREAEDQPRVQALFETAAEVLEGLAAAFRHFREGSEKAWR